MPGENETLRGACSFQVELEPREVDAGGEIAIDANLTCTPPQDRRGEVVVVKDANGNLVAELYLAEFDGETNRAVREVVEAPHTVGTLTWTAFCPSLQTDTQSFSAEQVELQVEVRPHVLRLVVWDVPPTVVAGERFGLKVGAKCSAECRLAGCEVEILKPDGDQMATDRIGEDTWPRTEGLYFAEFDLAAPEESGRHTWEARLRAHELELPHEERAASFGLTVGGVPECQVTIEAVDAESRNPIGNATVVLHPYRTSTDENGRAELRVPKGDYQIFVSAAKYFPVRRELKVTNDITTQAELTLEPPNPRL